MRMSKRIAVRTILGMALLSVCVWKSPAHDRGRIAYMLLQAYRRMSYVEAILNVSRADHTMRGTEDTSATLDNRPFLTVKGMVDEIVTVSLVSRGASSAAMKFALRLRCGCDGY